MLLLELELVELMPLEAALLELLLLLMELLAAEEGSVVA